MEYAARSTQYAVLYGEGSGGMEKASQPTSDRCHQGEPSRQNEQEKDDEHGGYRCDGAEPHQPGGQGPGAT